MTEPCRYEKEFVSLISDVAVIKEKVLSLDKRINGSYQKIQEHVQEGDAWRKVIFGTVIGLVINIIVFAYGYGKLVQMVTVK